MTSHNAREPVEAIPEALIDASAELCRALGIPSSPINCLPIIGALKADRRRDQWQPIDTAPKDGSNILVWCEGYKWPEVVRYELYLDQDSVEEAGEPGFWRYSDDVISDVCVVEDDDFTHWMPLPAAPKTEG